MANPRTSLKLFLYVFLSILIGYGVNQIPSIDIPLFALIFVLVLSTVLFYLVFEMDILNRAADRNLILEEQSRRLRQQLINEVLQQVVERLERSLHHKIPLDLKRQEERQRVGRTDLPLIEHSGLLDQVIRRVFNSFNTSVAPAFVAADISTADLLKRDDINGRLLILGEPGAGKTNELLTLTKELLQQAQQSDEAPIPVIFELSEWSSGQGKTFADWLIEQLQQKYTVPPQVAQQLIDQNQLFPLLDGLDELRRVDSAENASSEEIDRKQQAKQIQCMRAINAFLDVHSSTLMVVCCRRKEYEALEAQGEYLKRLNGAIYLQELDDEQIKDYLKDSNREPLWDLLVSQTELLKLARSPLFLLMLLVAYQGQPIQNTDELLDLYIEKQLSDMNNQGAYPPEKSPTAEETHLYLSWLAKKLKERGITEFLIERLQPSWLEQQRSKRLYKVLVKINFALIAGLYNGLLIGLIFHPRLGSLIGLSVGVIAGLLSEIDEINPVEGINFHLTKESRSGLFFGLLMGLALGVAHWRQGGSFIWLILGLLFGLSFGFMHGISYVESEIQDKQLPNQGIKKSARNLLYGMPAVIQHVSLRFVLYQSGVAPWNYAKFLEHAENHRFIQRVGGRYRFVHDLLRKRFAERYQSNWR